MKPTAFPFPKVFDPTINPVRSWGERDILIGMTRQDAAALAIALHEFDRAGAILAGPLHILRDQLDLLLTSRSQPAPSMDDILELRRRRRQELWRMLAEEEAELNAAAAIRADLSPTADHAAQAAMCPSAQAALRLTHPSTPELKDWQA